MTDLIQCKNKYCSSIQYCTKGKHKKCVQDLIVKCKYRELYEKEINQGKG